MKNTITFIFLGLLLTGCSRNDSEIQRQLTGTWVETGDSFRSTRVVSPSGSFDFQITGLTNGITVKEEGTLLARDGALIITLTKDSRTNATFSPQGLRGHIVHLNDHELVVRWDGIDKDMTMQKVKP
jgi:PBP1b-binding outer membrane lipoprotein LpoB